MKIKRTFLYLSLAIFMVFSLSLVTPESFAYWANVIDAPDTALTSTVTLGTWDQAFQWDANATYSKGDLVTNNGVTYKAKRDNPTSEPGVGKFNKDWAIF